MQKSESFVASGDFIRTGQRGCGSTTPVRSLFPTFVHCVAGIQVSGVCSQQEDNTDLQTSHENPKLSPDKQKVVLHPSVLSVAQLQPAVTS